MSPFDDMPLESKVTHDIWMEDDDVRKNLLSDIARHIVEEHVDLATEFKACSSEFDGSDCAGTVLQYAREVLSLGLLILEFKDAVREGDGDRVLLVWKYFLPLFKASGRKNYANEALTLLSQYHLTFPPYLAEQLKWSQFVNVQGLLGHNISCDLHMEHLNRVVKTAINGLGSNKSEKAIVRAGRAIGVLETAINSYDKEVVVSVPSGKHSVAAKMVDLEAIVKLLLESAVFEECSKKTYKSFLSLKTNLIRTLNEKDFKDWMVERFSVLHLQPNPPQPEDPEDIIDQGDHEDAEVDSAM